MFGVGQQSTRPLSNRGSCPLCEGGRGQWIPGRQRSVHLAGAQHLSVKPRAYLGSPLPYIAKGYLHRRSLPARYLTVAQGVSLFPAGRQQAKVKLPALLLRVTTDDVLNGDISDIVGQGVKGGATAVVLSEVDATSSAEDLYDAALKLQGVIRGRASLIIVDRSDIANASNADGVLLTSKGVPLPVARRTFKGRAALFGQLVHDTEEARTAAAEGANFLVFSMLDGSPPDLQTVREAKTKQKGGSIPVIPQFSQGGVSALENLLTGGVDGVSLDPRLLSIGAMACGVAGEVGNGVAAKTILQTLSKEANFVRETGSSDQTGGMGSSMRDSLVAEEKQFIQGTMEMLDRVSPEMDERSLLDGAAKQLDELFMVVVVGEFNSGKSSVINALLGGSYLEEGILPTTNEVSVLRYADSNGAVKTERDTDGIVQRYIPAELLSEISIVDTPGTNVVLDRQQRLTEEYVPRADMILFVMSADRPFTESEVKFLEYIRRWGKKVIFVVNKLDILPDKSQADEVKSFVAQNAKKLLSLNETFVWPVSAKWALDAKEKSRGKVPKGSTWADSRFQDLEAFIFKFFSGEAGGTSAGESIRLKLQTPLSVADALLDACRRQLVNELSAAEKDLAAVQAVRGQLEAFREEMKKDSVVQRRSARDLLDQIVARTEAFVDATLQLSNVQTLRGYLSSSSVDDEDGSSPEVAKGFGPVAIGTAVDDLRGVVDEHGTWLAKNLDIQVDNYRAFAEKCIKPKGLSLKRVVLDYGKTKAQQKIEESDTEEARGGDEKAKEGDEGGGMEEEEEVEGDDDTETVSSIIGKVMDNPGLGMELCECLMEAEIRDSVNATAGTAVAAIGIGVVLTVILPYTSEDFLALALSLVIGYVALLNLPLRRGEVKGKVRKVSGEVFRELDDGMEKDLEETLNECDSKVLEMVEPLERIFEADVQQVKDFESERSVLAADLEKLKARIANVE